MLFGKFLEKIYEVVDDGVSSVDPASISYEEPHAEGALPFVKTNEEGFNIEATPEFELFKEKQNISNAHDMNMINQNYLIEWRKELLNQRKESKETLIKSFSDLDASDVTSTFTNVIMSDAFDKTEGLNEEQINNEIIAIQGDINNLANLETELTEQYNYYVDNVHKFVGGNRLLDPSEFQKLVSTYRIQKQGGDPTKEIDIRGLTSAYRELKSNTHDRAHASQNWANTYHDKGQLSFNEIKRKFENMITSDEANGSEKLQKLLTVNVDSKLTNNPLFNNKKSGNKNYTSGVLQFFDEIGGYDDFVEKIYLQDENGNYVHQDIQEVLLKTYPVFMGNIAQNYNAATVLEQEAELYFASSVHAYTANLNNEIGGILENTGINTWQDIDTTLNSIFDKLWEYQQKGGAGINWDDFERMFENAEMQLQMINDGKKIDLGPYFDLYIDKTLNANNPTTVSNYLQTVGAEDVKAGNWSTVRAKDSDPDSIEGVELFDPNDPGTWPDSRVRSDGSDLFDRDDMSDRIIPITNLTELVTTPWDFETYDVVGFYDIVKSLEWDAWSINQNVNMDVIEGIQYMLGVSVDGVWGPDTQEAFDLVMRDA